MGAGDDFDGVFAEPLLPPYVELVKLDRFDPDYPVTIAARAVA